VDMSTPLLPEVVPEIDANPVSFYSGGGRLGSIMVWSLTRPSLPYVKFNVTILEFAYGGSVPDHRYRLALLALAMRVHPTFFDLETPLHSPRKLPFPLGRSPAPSNTPIHRPTPLTIQIQSTALQQYTLRQTDRQTDRSTDGISNKSVPTPSNAVDYIALQLITTR